VRARRLRTALAAIAAALLPLAACGSVTGGAAGSSAMSDVPSARHDLDPIEPSPTPRLPSSVESADGRRVTVRDVARIVPLWGSLAEITFTRGLGDRVVGRDVTATFAEAAHLPLVTRAHDVSAEAVLSLRPTVVLATTDSGPPEALDQIRAAGIPVVVVAEATTLAQIGPRIRLVAAALGVPAAGDRLAARTQERLDAQAEPAAAHRPSVAFLYLRGQAGVALLGGEGSGADAMIDGAGGTDAGTALGLGPYTPITSESLVEAAPDVLLMMTDGLRSVGGRAGLLEVPGVAQTPAARHGRVVTIDDELLVSFGPRTPRALATLRRDLAAAMR
jgi:iron complex transport system substrate-binding protein